MLRFALFAALFAVVCSIPINDKSKSSDVDVFVGGSITEFLAQNPEVKILDELDEIAFQSQNGTISSVFKWGHREAGDRVVEHTTFNEEWEYPQFITIRMIYPQKGDPGATVNMVEIHFERSKEQARAYWVSGGLGQKQATVYVETKSTLIVRFDGKVYGHN